MKVNEPICMREHLETLGMTLHWLDRHGYFVGVGRKNGVNVFRPQSHLYRLLFAKRIPISTAVRPGMHIKFLKSLKYPMLGHGSLLSIQNILGKIIGFFIKVNLSRESHFLLGVDEQSKIQDFPFDEWLKVLDVGDFRTVYSDQCFLLWTIDNVNLGYVTQVEVDLPLSETV